MTKYAFLVLLLFPSLNSFAQSGAKFSKEDVLEDLKTLRKCLEDAHYNLYTYTTEQAFDSVYQQVKGAIQQDSLSLLETTSLFQQVAAAANNGHTWVAFPGQSYGEYVYAGGTVFPLEVAFEDGKALVRKNWSGNENIEVGSELLSINGEVIEEVQARIYPLLSAERPYFKNAKIELYSLPRLYWQVFGEQDAFDVEIRSEGEIEPYTLKAINTIEDYEMKRQEVFHAKMKLEFYEDAAYINPGDFSGEEEKYQQFIDSAFAVINEQGSKNLIIDFRNNLGGNDSFSDYLISYFADKPFQWNSCFTLKTSKFLKEYARQNIDTTDAYWQKILSHENGETYPYYFDDYQPQPEEKRFLGNIYVLVNRQSYSQSAVTAAQIQDYGFGKIVGEETGDYPSLLASIFQYPLPITEITVHIPKGYIVRVNGSTKAAGVMPDIFIKDHLLDEQDEILDGLLERIGRGE